MLSTFWLRNVLRATTACTCSTSQLPKVCWTWGAFSFFACKCASRHNGMHFFERDVFFLAFSLANVLGSTTACTFPTSQLPKVLRTWGVFSFFTCKCASRHNGVQFFISHPASWLRTRRFREPTFRPSRATNHRKHSVSRFSYLFVHMDLLSSEAFSFVIFFLLLFSSLTLPISAFHLSILSEVWLLNFLRSYYRFTNNNSIPQILPVVPHKAVAEVSKIGNL